MTAFFWSSGHIGWPFFNLVVFSILCLLTTDLVWRIASIRWWRLLLVAIVVWMAGVAALIVFGSA